MEPPESVAHGSRVRRVKIGLQMPKFHIQQPPACLVSFRTKFMDGSGRLRAVSIKKGDFFMKRSIVLALALAIMVSAVSAQATQLIKKDNVLSWSSSTGQRGSMKVAAVSGSYFEIDQSNDSNKGAGVLRLFGAIVDNGSKIVLINTSQWKEVWEGNFANNEISGKIMQGSSSYSFKIGVAAAKPSTAPFVSGKTLRWKTDASGGQSGTIYVVSTNGLTFALEQKNVNNPGAGITKLDGEIKDGKVYIYNRQWNETWVGALSNGTVSGKINNQYNFSITE
jgi:hypothetical protein